ncbi:N-acetylhexosaminidase [Crucibulum laeve]|uniref:Beta-hexosaminidase n=1 Tax=Crucibulum laeve TaxID=68775 RepID=A0A5C3M1S4_9AGAR|nr:N-acetylhexosaminidase [Crucibulum laeve]
MSAIKKKMKLKPAFLLCFAPLCVQALWPIPKSLQTGSGLLKLSSTFDINILVTNPPQDLLDAVTRTKGFLKTDKLQRLVVGRGANDSAALAQAPSLSRLTLSLAPGSTVRPIATEAAEDVALRNEVYSLSVPSNGSDATIVASTTLGLFRGLTTFNQMFYDLQGITYSFEAPITIVNDAPVFPYRGFMLDTARHFFPVADIKRTLDAMSMVKMSTLHWHAVDSQSFPIEIPGFPELSQKGAYSAEETYSTADVQDIVKYAGARGIDVMVELDTPSHASAISNSHPEHVACAPGSPAVSGETRPPGGLRIATPATQTFAANFMAAIAKTLPSRLFSTGGDEVNVNCYTKDAQTQADLKSSGKTLDQAISDFVVMEQKALLAIGKTPVVWEEMAIDHNVALSNKTIVLVWHSENIAPVATKGLRFIHAHSDYFYLDCGGGSWLGNRPTLNSWCDPFKTWQKAYTFDPLANVTTAQKPLIMGGQQLLWTEQSSAENVDSIVWPRAAVSAEIFWTGATLPTGVARNVAEALPRLHDVRYRMVQRGIRAIPLQPTWCALRPHACDD